MGCWDEKEAPKMPFLADIFRGEFCPGVKFGCGIAPPSRSNRVPRAGVAMLAFFGEIRKGEF
ncbi:uncharacterized protein BDW70DRAFT_131364 [Aspergillus foveolatus]|uniref:uncharacterized protein n=1 Tax=Aspergillus foveolatus TaxID=210207 RepID=UPI003CCD2F92